MTDTESNLGDDAHDAALAWVVRLRSDAVTESDWAALTAWLETSADHLAAFEAAESVDMELDTLAPAILAGLAGRSADILPFKPRRAPPRPRWGGGRVAIAAGVAFLSVMVGIGAWRASEGVPQIYRTGPGETRAITLADGSHINLDAASTMSVQLGWFKRKVRLNDAVASFDVAKDAKRPFEIAVDDQRVRVIGTEFNIADYGGQVDVTVRRGIVAVYQNGQDGAPVARLTKGWALHHTVGSLQSVSNRVDPNGAFAWSEGRLVCDQRSLSQIVAYLNRRYRTPVRLSGDAGSRRFSGVLELGDENDVLRRLAAYLSLSVHRSGQGFALD